MVAKSLIDIARARLGDTKKQRWTDQRLLQIVNQGQADLCKLTGIYRKEIYLALANGQTRYTLPKDCMTIRRIVYRDEVVSLSSRNDLDAGKLPTNEFVCLKDNISMGKIDISPAQEGIDNDVLIIEGTNGEETFTLTSPWGVVTAATDPFDIDTPFGTITDIERVMDTTRAYKFGECVGTPWHPKFEINYVPDIYGVVTAMKSTPSTDKHLFGFITDSEVARVVGQYGLVTSITKEYNTMRIFYEAVPASLSSDNLNLVIPDMWEGAMVRYIVGTALQDDNDANNIQRGELELQKYYAELKKARELASKDFSGGAKDKYITRYRGI